VYNNKDSYLAAYQIRPMFKKFEGGAHLRIFAPRCQVFTLRPSFERRLTDVGESALTEINKNVIALPGLINVHSTWSPRAIL